ncbi:vesicle-fusing ATPase [Microbacterium trichothecenolyticum]|uniref:ATP-binding protein n=1 Tax=Microbacterium trichothecenolyticum TaxID=69370 RepID=UPI002865FE31|nr:ATP-binding protein [Microbacterium trichothecenolyticum]MDR7186725.1 vesicle-fusing ATPase [Microbacterium trichothecenolyticum]
MSTTAAFDEPGRLRDAPRDRLVSELARIAALLRGDDAPRPKGDGSPLADLGHRLGLSAFECDVLMLAAAVELDAQVAADVAAAQGGTPSPTFGLALSVLPAAHWDALSPDRPLRRRRLVRLGAGDILALRSLRIDEAVLHRLTGLGPGHLDGLIADPLAGGLTAAQTALADELAAAVRAVDGRVLVRLGGADADTRAGVVARVAAALGGGVLSVRDAAAAERDPADTAAVLDREAVLDGRLIATDDARLIALLEAEVVVTDGPGDIAGRVTLARTVPLPTAGEEAALWRAALEPAGDAEAIVVAERELSQHFRLPAGVVAAVAAEWLSLPDRDVATLRRLVRERSRTGFGALAQRIEPRARWDDLVLPEGQRELLREIERHVRHRATVLDDWGFASRSDRGLGVTALFAGESGTGKTMAAEVLAGSLGLDLYRIDLSALVSKYIGETEKHLSTVFDAAEASGAVLLFDEADALFGKRSDVKDSHDRYANLEVAYLLQRMESYRGLAILTTNLRGNVDRAFLRRIRFVVQFPFPDEASRAEIWRRVFPAATPLAEVDPAALARIQLSGGAIRQIALSAAFAAADEGVAIGPEHLLLAATREAAKSERALTAAETGLLRGGAR